MTLYTLGPNENKDGPFAEVHARNEFEARRRVQSVDTRRNWHDLSAVYCVPVGSTRAMLLLERSGFLRGLRTCRPRSWSPPPD
jgi:hypothetical protein